MEKPKIHPTADNLPFWEGCNAQELRYQACTDCGTVQLIPRGVCTHCHGHDLAWRQSTCLGVVLSHTTVYRAPTPAFKTETPYVIALIDMDEGFRLMVNVHGGGSASVAIGERVRIAFETRGTYSVPTFRLETL
ncbi:Zn-ribbon domain-containing OB-fold protein [Bordetella petrii]|uniref:Zn-ribbon domain-containing OB-fold protein n=1 Tax=Bordetella petrii TaxID=94624 RepID=UPI001E4E02A5|nr:OB-fold domain-containing protein [Bordetella petrii]MCD0502285.1 OB-fold domain-containing protein [Bordetella petrii]